MKSLIMRGLLVLTCMTLFCTGCSGGKTTDSKKQAEEISITKNNKGTKEDGQVISIKKIKVAGAPHLLDIYSMMFWSEGIKNEAFVAAPKDSGTYALKVFLHGGYSVPVDEEHITKMGEGADTTYFNAESLIGYPAIDCITVVPLYRGYGKSEGTVEGLYENTVDTENAITAVMNYFNNKNKRHVNKGHLYLEGFSLGGGIALKIASERSDVLSVVAASPFVGWDIFGDWVKKHFDDKTWFNTYLYAKEAYGPIEPENTVIKKQSIPFKKIEAPTLLIQGTDDPIVPSQTVQTFYEEMKENKQNVTLKMVDGGNHALTNKSDVLNQIFGDWYEDH